MYHFAYLISIHLYRAHIDSSFVSEAVTPSRYMLLLLHLLLLHLPGRLWIFQRSDWLIALAS